MRHKVTTGPLFLTSGVPQQTAFRIWELRPDSFSSSYRKTMSRRVDV
jgi:hypothetical protein